MAVKKNQEEKGSAIIIALLVMVLLLGFVALAVTRTTNETVASSNDAAESRAFEAAQASLETMTRNFDKIFETKLTADSDDLARIISQKPPGFDTGYTFEQGITRYPDATSKPVQVVLTGSQYQGLTALRDEWKIETLAKDNSNGVQVALRRRFFNNRIPIFQFGIFYDDDLEFHPGPRFDFGGRVHSNGSLFLMAQDGLYFSSKVTAVGEIFTDVARNGFGYSKWGEKVFIKDASGTDVQLKSTMGSVVKSPTNGSPVFDTTDMPTVYKNDNWTSNQNQFQGNLLNHQKSLDLPIRISSKIDENPLDYIELIKRGKNVKDLFNNGTGTVTSPNIVPVTTTTADADITSTERYYNKTGIRVTLADSKAKLPGCATATGAATTNPCGVCLNGKADGSAGTAESDGSRGYQPLAMTGTPSYQATRLNGNRFYAGNEIWIKVEIVGIIPATNTYAEPRDITKDFLSLGLTEPAPLATGKFLITSPATYYLNGIDSRSIIKMQRFAMDGVQLPGNTNYSHYYSWDSIGYNIALTDDCTNSTYTSGCSTSIDSNFSDNAAHRIPATVDGSTRYRRIAAFPINMFDTREGLFYEDQSSGKTVFNPTGSTNYGTTNVPWAGVMSLIDIDVANLREFLTNKTWDGKFPGGLKSTDIPSANGWVLYLSDRRGDFDFDGEYDMEDIYGNNDCQVQPGENINNNKVGGLDYLDTAGLCPKGNLGTGEAARYVSNGAANINAPSTSIGGLLNPWNSHAPSALAATLEHKFYRRGFRLINGQTLPGIYDSTNPANTKGFTVASENGVYVLGNYNATGISSVGTPTPSTSYLPQDTALHIPASIVSDAVTILSPSWKDSESFKSPFDLNGRTADNETFIRFAMLTGDSRSNLNGDPNQGGGDTRLSGGVHNFLRFLEKWGGNRVNYSGSLINLFNSRNNNGAFKCCNMVYSPPTRNWVFDVSFTDPDRLPPGTPFFQVLQLTGFERLD